MTDDEKTAAEKVAHKMWVTKGCRFSAHARLSRQAGLSNFAIALISFYVAGVSAASLVPSLIPSAHNTLISLLTCLASILIIIISVFEGSAEYGKSAIEMYRCASEINHEYDLLKLKLKSGTLTTQETENFANRYHEIIRRYPINHDPADFATFRLENSKELNVNSISTKISLWLSTQKPLLLYRAAIAVTLILSISTIYFLTQASWQPPIPLHSHSVAAPEQSDAPTAPPAHQ